jgi:polysaccharide biosynthesis protein PelA
MLEWSAEKSARISGPASTERLREPFCGAYSAGVFMPRLQNIQSYACYYGTGQLDQLQRFSLVILQPENYSPSEIADLSAHGTLTLGYLSLGESAVWVEGASWYLRDSAGCLLKNPDWNTYYVDTRDPAWLAYLSTTCIPAILAHRRFDGLFLDTLDSQDLFPEIRNGSIALVHAIHAAFPDALLVANRGFTILDHIAADLDGVVFECFSLYHRAGRYFTWNSPEREYNEQLAGWLQILGRTYPLAVFTLDHALPGDKASREYAASRARAHGFIPYLSTANLDQLYYLPSMT